MNKTFKLDAPSLSYLNTIEDKDIKTLLYFQWQGEVKIEKMELSEEQKRFFEESEVFHLATVEAQHYNGSKMRIVLPVQEKQMIQYAREILQYFDK